MNYDKQLTIFLKKVEYKNYIPKTEKQNVNNIIKINLEGAEFVWMYTSFTWPYLFSKIFWFYITVSEFAIQVCRDPTHNILQEFSAEKFPPVVE